MSSYTSYNYSVGEHISENGQANHKADIDSRSEELLEWHFEMWEKVLTMDFFRIGNADER